MGLGGGGGGGTILGVSNSFTGPATALEILGDHAYGFSGKIAITGDSGGATQELLVFTSGNYYFVGTLNFSTTAESGVTVSFETSFNGSVVTTMNVDTRGNGGFIWPTSYNIIIPAYTDVAIKWGIDTSTESGTAILSGRIYR